MDLFPQDNAASIVTEVDSIGTLVNEGSSSVTTSVSVAPQNGNYNIHILSSGSGTWGNIYFDIDAIIGHTYRWTFWYRSPVYNQQACQQWTGVDISPNLHLTESVWTEQTVDVVATETTIQCRFFVSRNIVNVGDILEVDGFSIIDLDAPATTTVEVEWIDSISAAATGNKIYRDDVEIADIANGIQIYQDTTAETGTEYKYEVQAYDGVGGETTLETVGVNTQFITTA